MSAFDKKLAEILDIEFNILQAQLEALNDDVVLVLKTDQYNYLLEHVEDPSEYRTAAVNRSGLLYEIWKA